MMTILVLAILIVIPCLMVFLQKKWATFRHSFNVLAIIAAILFSTIAATSITQIILEDVVFMTTIHAVFLNPLFLMTGANLGLYVVHRLIDCTIREKAKS